jgi:hypothetical protein
MKILLRIAAPVCPMLSSIPGSFVEVQAMETLRSHWRGVIPIKLKGWMPRISAAKIRKITDFVVEN